MIAETTDPLHFQPHIPAPVQGPKTQSGMPAHLSGKWREPSILDTIGRGEACTVGDWTAEELGQ